MLMSFRLCGRRCRPAAAIMQAHGPPSGNMRMCTAKAAQAKQAAGLPLTVAVASKNKVKVEAARLGLEKCLGHLSLSVISQEAASGVPDQPWGDDETLIGARNRAAAAAAQHPTSLIVAIEGGVGYAQGHSSPPRTPASAPDLSQHRDQDCSATTLAATPTLECFAWVVIRSSTGAESVARSGSFLLPPAVSNLVLQGVELGAADDQVFQRVKSGQGSGTVGFLSHGLITRQLYYEHAVVLALLPFMNPQHYGQEYELSQ